MELNEYAVKVLNVLEDLESLQFFGDYGKLSKTEYRLLKEVVSERRKGRDIISSELARRLGVTRSAVSQIVTKLEKSEIVVRTAAPDDRKIAYIRLSGNAEANYDAQCAALNAILEECAAKFGRERMQRLSVDCSDFMALVRDAREKRAAGEAQK